ncbi:hypothetical protein TFLX_03138 [Thermoflexales bacterium]|nr:hypothetical protein TFLX_03138 [Thermoflexales bacterium]
MAKRKSDEARSIDDEEAEGFAVENDVSEARPVAVEQDTGNTQQDNVEQKIEVRSDPNEMLTVKYVGPVQAILGGQRILHGETRQNVTRYEFERAETAHPGGFKIVE